MGQNVQSFKTEEMMPVSPDEFIPGSTVPADIFVKLTDNKYVLIARQGSKASMNELHLIERDDVRQLFVRRIDYKNCVGQNLTVAGIIVSREEIPDDRKAEFLSRTTESVFKEISDMGFNHEAFEHSKMVSKSIQTLVESKNDLLAIVTLMEQVPNYLMRHSMAVSAISVMIAKGMNWVFAQTLEKLALGGILHDVGIKELPRELIEKPRHLMTYEEVQNYESHVFRGVEILRSMPSISDDLIAIVYEHHENSIGQGYPRKLRDFRSNPLGRVVALADFFSELVLKSPNNPNPRTAIEALNYIEITMGQPFNKAAFHGLKVVLNNGLKSSKIKIIS